MTILYLVRHGEKVGNGPGDPGLSPRGRAQAAAAGAYLREKGIERVYTSPIQRALQTAEIIAQMCGAPLVEDQRLRERMNWGDLPGQSFEAFVDEWLHCDEDPDYTPPAGLSARQSGENLFAVLREAAQQSSGTTAIASGALAVVTHGGALGDFLNLAIPAPELARLHPDWQDDGSSVITHCSITTLHWTPAGLRLETLALRPPGSPSYTRS